MAPQLRPRTNRVKPKTYGDHQHDHTEGTSRPSTSSSSPPVYTIDLSLPPAQRYVQLARAYKSQIQNLQSLFDDVIKDLGVRLPGWVVHLLASVLLKRLYSAEQTEELRGISTTADFPMYLLIAYNTFLDMFMGCTSGGVLTSTKRSGTRMMHFRTLDWDMPELRKLIVQLHFIEKPGGAVVARSVTYVGFIGVLTGVKRDLSISLNFRPYHNDDHSLSANAKFRFHQVAVLLGWRPSIASVLRDLIVPQGDLTRNGCAASTGESSTLDTICTTLPKIPSTAAYLTFCDGHETIVLEKDLTTAKILRSSSFIATTNHDAIYDTKSDKEHKEAAQTEHSNNHGQGMQEIIDESVERKACLVRKWTQWSGKQQERTACRKIAQTCGVPLQDLKEWMLEHPTCDTMTHFVCTMDPARGEFRWIRRFEDGEIEEGK